MINNMETKTLSLGAISQITDHAVVVIVQLNSFEEGELFDEVREFPISPFKDAVKLKINNIIEIETIIGTGFSTIKFKDASEENAKIYKNRYDEAHEKLAESFKDIMKDFNNKQF